MATMKVAEVPSPGADFRIVEREIPKPDSGHVLIKVQACGVCHSDGSRRMAPGLEFSIHAFRGMRSRASLRN